MSELATIGDELDIIVHEDLTDEDAVRISYLDTDNEGIPTQISDQENAPTHSGTVSFDGNNYKVADTVTITLEDADLNTDSDTSQIYRIAGDIIGYAEINSTGIIPVINYEEVLLEVTFDDVRWEACYDVLTGNKVIDGFGDTGSNLR